MTSIPHTLMSPIPPSTNYSSIDEAQTRLRVKPKFHLFRRKSTRGAPHPNVSIVDLPLANDQLIDIDPVSDTSSVDDDQDQYRWAVVYENQRGIKLFMTPHYSSYSLLPTDPSPFTTPSSSPATRSKQPDVSLALYPLPDGSWHWLSPWMIDMRSDSGEVQVDGFEYNLAFRIHKWHPEAGPLSWVRRRRWIRLMMRPAKRKDTKRLSESLSPSSVTTAGSIQNRRSIASASILESFLEESVEIESKVDEVWLSPEPQVNWEQCRLLMRDVGTDGRILELWQRWLGDDMSQDKKGKRKQWTEDDEPLPSKVPVEKSSQPIPVPPPIANILPALRQHGDEILRSFKFPESRARFLKVLERVGVLHELNSETFSTEVEFWSYVKDVKKRDSVSSS